MVSGASISIMFTNMIIAVFIPIFLLIAYRKRYGASYKAFFVGCATFAIFALVLESGLHMLVLNVLPTGKIIQENWILYALYGGLAAGLFEETGRFFAMKYVMRDECEKPYNALMYGAGHGGIEVLLVLGISMLTNWIYSVMINSGQISVLLEGLGEADKTAMQGVVDELVSMSPFVFMAAPVERISAVVFHISASVLIWVAVTKKVKWLYPVAILLHFGLDALAVTMSKLGVPVAILEAVVMAYSILVAVGTNKYVWKKYALKTKEVIE